MAEYIEFHCPHGDDFEGGDECDRCEKYELCMETPNVDVIERSKIDKVKSDIELMLEQEKQKDGTYTEVGQGIAIALGLLKNEIGE